MEVSDEEDCVVDVVSPVSPLQFDNSVQQWHAGRTPSTNVSEGVVTTSKKCDRCGYVTSDESTFELHMQLCKAAVNDGLPSHAFSRNYFCRACTFTTTKSKVFLYHQVDVHGSNLKIFSCDRCDYAARARCKIVRHRRMIHSVDDAEFQPHVHFKGASDAGVSPAIKKVSSRQRGSQKASLATQCSEAEEAPPSPDREDGSTSNRHAQSTVVPQHVHGKAGEVMIIEESGDSADAPGDEKCAAIGGRLQTGSKEVSECGDVPRGTADKVFAKRIAAAGGSQAAAKVSAALKMPGGVRLKQTVVNGTPVFRCLRCSFMSPLRWKASKHYRLRHLTTKRHSCPSCPFVTSSRVELLRHKMHHSTKAVCRCPECDYITSSQTNLNRHMANHSLGLPLKCPFCSFSSTGATAVQRHTAEHHHPTEKDDASSTAVSIPSKRPLISTRESNVTGADNEKPKKPRAGQGVSGATVSSSPLTDEDETSNTMLDPETLACDSCTFVAKWPSDLRRHQKVHTQDSRHYCTLCPRHYKYRGDLNVHMRRCHAQSRESPRGNREKGHWSASHVVAKSPVASSSRNASADPNSHVHSPSKQVSAVEGTPPNLAAFKVSPEPSLQTKASRASSSAARQGQRLADILAETDHDSTTSAEPPLTSVQLLSSHSYRCVSCSYSTNCKSRLDAHMRSHATHKPFRCMFCSYDSYWRGDTKKHMERHHSLLLIGRADPYKLIERTFQEDLRKAERERYGQSMYSETDAQSHKQQDNKSSQIIRPGGRLKITPMRPAFDTAVSPGQGFVSTTLQGPLNSDDKGQGAGTSSPGVKPYKCSACGHRTNQIADMKAHFSMAHSSLVNVTFDLLTIEELLGMGVNEEDVAMYYPKAHGENEGGKSKIIDVNSRKAEGKKAGSEKPYGCSACGKRSRWKSNLTKHVRLMHAGTAGARVVTFHESPRHPARSYSSEGNGSSSKVFLNGHVLQGAAHLMGQSAASAGGRKALLSKLPNRSGRYKCPLCHLRSHFAWVIKRHLRIVHHSPTGAQVVEVATDGGDHTDERPFQCSVCAQKSYFKRDLQKHILRVHKGEAQVISCNPEQGFSASQATGSDQQSEVSVASNDLQAEKHKCGYCSFTSQWRNAIIRHSRQKHHHRRLRIISKDVNSSSGPQAQADMSACQMESPSLRAELSTMSGNRGNISGDVPINTAMHAAARPLGNNDDTPAGCLMWLCARCPYNHEDIQNVLAHLHGRHHQNAYQCSLCQFFSDAEEDMVSHIQTKHVEESNEIVASRKWIHNMAWTYAQIRVADESGLKKDKGLGHPEDGKLTGCNYNCIFCDMKTYWRSAIIRHLKERHNRDPSKGEITAESLYRKEQTAVVIKVVNQSGKVASATQELRKRHRCNKCPFVTHKACLYSKHMQRHQNLPGNDIKCQYCDYWVSAPHFLYQHLRFHHGIAIQGSVTGHYTGLISEGKAATAARNEQSTPSYALRRVAGNTEEGSNGSQGCQLPLGPCHSSKEPGRRSPSSSSELSTETKTSSLGGKMVPVPVAAKQHAAMASHGSQSVDQYVAQKKIRNPRRFPCTHCPYRCKSSTDLLYHKQFHRPKASATFKCPKCKYWVSRNGLLKQHIKVHEPDYLAQFSMPPSTSAEPAVKLAPTGKKREQKPSLPDGQSDGSDSDVSATSSSHCTGALEVAELKHRLMASRIQPVVLLMPPPADLMTQAAGRNSTQYGYARKLYKCDKCPYAAPLPSMIKKHGMMHGRRQSITAIAEADTASQTPAKVVHECKFCDFSSDFECLMKHVIVHTMEYEGDFDEAFTADNDEELKELARKASEGATLVSSDSGFNLKYNSTSGEYVLEQNADAKRYSCEKCPYATSRKEHYARHINLHGSRQRYVCGSCDYSVPVFNLLQRHEVLHQSPGLNLSICQRPTNLMDLHPVPADTALEEAKLGADEDGDMYENKHPDSVPPLEDIGTAGKKLYRCDRCPFANVRKDHLISHMKFHYTRSDYKCPYCDYSVTKSTLLNQHVKLHFTKNFVAEDNTVKELAIGSDAVEGACVRIVKAVDVEPEFVDISEVQAKIRSGSSNGNARSSQWNSAEPAEGTCGATAPFVCQYCDREFSLADDHLDHESQHLIGYDDD